MDQLYATSTLGELIVDAIQRHPRRTAFVYDGVSFTYEEMGHQIGRAIRLFRKLGAHPGDTVIQLSGNRPEMFFVMAAAYISGLRSVTLSTTASIEDLAFMVRDAGAKIFVTDSANARRVDELRRECHEVEHWLCHSDDDALVSLWEAARAVGPDPLRPAASPEHVIRIAYTGGTTGTPKGVMLTDRSLVTNTLLALTVLNWPDGVKLLCTTPISQGAGSFIIPALWRGGAVVLRSRFRCEQFLQDISEHGIHATWLVPTMIYDLLDFPGIEIADLTSLRTVYYSAAPIAPARLSEALSVFGPTLIQGYGQTEAPNTVLVLTQADHVSGAERLLASAGRPFPGIRVRLLDDEHREVAVGEIGEICVQGPLVMAGYLNQPELTAAVFRGGWLHTGDLARQDEEGYFYILDRKRDMIISGGSNVYCREVEDVLMSHASVAAAAVIGTPHPRWGEAVTAIVVRRGSSAVSAEALKDLVRKKKGPVYAPKIVEFVDNLPLTSLGKPDKKALRACYGAPYS